MKLEGSNRNDRKLNIGCSLPGKDLGSRPGGLAPEPLHLPLPVFLPRHISIKVGLDEKGNLPPFPHQKFGDVDRLTRSEVLRRFPAKHISIRLSGNGS